MNTTYPIHTKRKGPFPCKGSFTEGSPIEQCMTLEQAAWMKANKPTCFTGNLWFDLAHLPQHLRHV